MGINFDSLHLLTTVLPHLGDLSQRSILTLAVQDCHFSYDDLLDFLRRHHVPHVTLEQSEVRTTSGFKWLSADDAKKRSTYLHQESLFRVLGFAPENIHALDVDPYEQAEIIHDLNTPVVTALVSAFDIIVDGGTTEHVFSTKDALSNLCRMCKIGGIVVNISPSDLLNHGFVNFNADFFRDWFTANGFREIALKYFGYPTNPRRAGRYYLEYDPPERLTGSLRPVHATAVFSAYMKEEDALTFTVPQQGWYRGLWEGTDSSESREGGLGRFVPQQVREQIGSSVIYTWIVKRRGRKITL